MDKNEPTTAQAIASAAIAFQRECTGIAPRSATVLLGEKTLVVRLHDALSTAEKLLAQTPQGAARVEEYHRELFRNSSATLHHDLQKILGVEVQESSVEVDPATGRLVEVLPSGDLVQVFVLSQAVETQAWTTPDESPAPP